MQKKIFLFLFLIIFTLGCDYSPIHSKKENNYNVKITSLSGDNQINSFLEKELKRKSKNSSEIIEIKINTNYSKRILAKDTKSFVTDYELKVVGNFELKIDEELQSFSIIEKFKYKNLNNNYEQNNYENIIKKNLTKAILSKLNFRINNFQ